MTLGDGVLRKRVGRARLCLELAERLDGRDHVWALVASLPGRDSVLTYTWRVQGASMTESQLRDMGTRVTQLLTQAIVLIDGAQGELRLVK